MGKVGWQEEEEEEEEGSGRGGIKEGKELESRRKRE